MPKFFQIGNRFGISKVFSDLFTETVVVQTMQDMFSFVEGDVIGFEGGEDISPELYGEKRHKYCGYTNTERDKFESAVFNKYVGRAKFLGICRGSQFLCAMSGGKLAQHIDNHGNDHIMEFTVDMSAPSATCLVTSTHHQMMWPYNLHRDDYSILGWSPKPLSKQYQGFVDNAQMGVVRPEKIREPEVVYFWRTDALAIQYHPEFMSKDAPAVEVARDFVKGFLLPKKVKATVAWELREPVRVARPQELNQVALDRVLNELNIPRPEGNQNA